MNTPKTQDSFSIIHNILELYSAFDERVKRMSKHSRYTLGIKSETEMIEILELVVLAISKASRSRILILEKVDTKLKVLRLVVRLLHITKGIDQKAYISIIEKIVVISKMNGGWLLATKRKEPAPAD